MTIQADPTSTRTRRTRSAGAKASRVDTVDTVDTVGSVDTVEAPPATRPAPSRSRTAAAQRAYARRAHREGRKVDHPIDDDVDHGAGRASFVVLIIVLLTVGVAATLWLSTQAIEDSYRLDNAKKEADRLSEQAADLQREVTEKESASSLADRAKAMGMVPAGDPARLIVQPDGTVVVVGEPKPVEKPAPPADQQNPPAGTGNGTQEGTGTGGTGAGGTGAGGAPPGAG